MSKTEKLEKCGVCHSCESGLVCHNPSLRRMISKRIRKSGLLFNLEVEENDTFSMTSIIEAFSY